MSRIAKAFEHKKALIAFVTGGDPDLETTQNLIITLAESGVDLIKIGIPFSDPVAAGPLMQVADERALANGCTVDQLFEMVKRVRMIVDIPLLFMTYANPVFAYGKERFMKNCQACGIDGVIVPDLPFEEKDELASECRQYEITQIAMIVPASKTRIETIAKEAEGFIYCLCSSEDPDMPSTIANMIDQVKQTSAMPCAVHLEDSTLEQAHQLSEISDGLIIGNAIVELVTKHGRNSIEPVKQYLQDVKLAMGK